MATNHDKTAKRLAKKKGVDYNKGKGPDVIGENCVIEVETAKTAPEGLRQLQGYRKRVYIAGANDKAMKPILKAIKGTTVGAMDPNGNIVEPSTRKTT